MKKKLKCENCGKVFYRYESSLSKQNFCSYDCFQQYKYKRTLNHDFFEIIDKEEKAYWLGFLYADGNISHNKRKQKSITLALSSKDESHVSKFADIFNVSARKYKRGDLETCVCSITSKKMWKDLFSKALLPNKTFIDSDEIFNFIPEKLNRHFIRGFFDGDGGISINEKTRGICFHMIGTQKVLIKIKKVIVKNTFVNNVNLFPKKNIKNIFILEWSGVQQLEVIRQFLYEDAQIYLKRKFDRFQIIKKRYNDFILNRKCGYRGVSKSGKKFIATIYHNKKLHYLGTFDTEIEAAKIYDKNIIKFKKPRYRLNFSIEK